MKTLAKIVIFIALVLSAPAFAQTPPLTWVNELGGTVGGHRIGLSMTMRDTQFVAAHYFYVSHLIDIPLTGQIDGENLTLTEPGGAAFHLHFFNNQPHKGPLDFDHSSGMTGTWSDGKTVLPVTLSISFASVGSDDAYEAMARRFLHGVLTGNRKEAASAVSFPLTVNGARHVVIRNKASLYARWDEIFTAKYLAILRHAVPHDMFVRDVGAMVGNGEVWFNTKGAYVLNLP